MSKHSHAAIVGCGSVGRKRAEALVALGCEHIICCDLVRERAEALAHSLPVTTDVVQGWQYITAATASVVVVATSHDKLAEIAVALARHGKHVLIEKPGARRAEELVLVRDAASRTGVCVRVGFNHRCHPAIEKAYDMVSLGVIGQLTHLRGTYGHGGRLGYEKEWRADPIRSGGGELLDQGSHLIDLARWFLGDFSAITGHVANYFWPMSVEDNAFLTLRTPMGQTAVLHASWTEWKNKFSLEVFGTLGKLEVNGLGGSYGAERLTHYKMTSEMGPPQTRIWEYPQPDNSWERELKKFFNDISFRRESTATLADAVGVLNIVEKVYKGEQK